jgi:hypothetical protein
MNDQAPYKPYMVQASVFLAWWKRLNELVAHEPPQEGANLSDAEHRHDFLRIYGERAGALASRSVAQPGTAASPLVGETRGVDFSTAPSQDFDWVHGAIDFGVSDAEDPDPETLIRDIVALTGIPEHS